MRGYGRFNAQLLRVDPVRTVHDGVLPAMDEPIIEVEDVALSFGDHVVLEHLNLTIRRGETTCIVGRSGSGKTVLLKLMLGLVVPTRGRVRLFGRDLATVTDNELLGLRRRASMLFQNYALFDALSAQENVVFPLLERREESRTSATLRAHDLMTTLGLADSEHLLPSELSGGMRKRVSLARALVVKPELVFFDEPTTGLDPILVERVDDMIARARREYGITAVIVSHDLASVQRLAERVVFLDEGKIAFSGTFDQFVTSALPTIQIFLGTHAAHHSPSSARVEAPAVEVVEVQKRFGKKQVLRGVNLVVPTGRITVLIGGSGSGKSVMMKIILGMLRPDAGAVRLFGHDLATLAPRELESLRAQCSLVFQQAALLDWLDVEANIAFPLAEGLRWPRHRVIPAVAEIIERLQLGSLRRRLPSELSAGERKRVAIARAVVTRPRLLIYDEPTTGQDPQRTQEIDDLIVETQERFDVTSLVISHDMESTFRIAHTVALLHQGQIVACGSPAELRAASNPHVRRFLECGLQGHSP